MKKIYISVLAMSLLGFISCDNVMDIHKQYVEDGETVYAPRVDSMVFKAGEGRVLFQCWLVNSPNVKTVNVYWNDGLNKHSITVPSSTSDTVLVEDFIPDMGEQSYTFDVRTVDAYGHQSLKTTASGASYGVLFRSTLNQRRINGISINEVLSQIQIPWGVAVENLVRSEIRYKTVGNETKIVRVNPTESLTSITDATDGSPFEYRSSFLPEPDAIDTFSLDWERMTIDPVVFFNQTSWEVIGWSDQDDVSPLPASTIIDGIDNNSGSYWHSDWSATKIPPPHWAVIDMKTPKNITQIVTYRALGRSGAKTVRYFVSDNPDPNAATWVQIGNDVVFPNNSSPQMLTTNIPSPDTANKRRYLKIYLPDSNNGQDIQIAEIYVYGNY
ncbi:hypothetical protein AGMMS50239_22430 [Bacteroidia bacterium]|nr:hypothetical protein AGMMS50239_22430 [Bacteroidia bacterium]